MPLSMWEQWQAYYPKRDLAFTKDYENLAKGTYSRKHVADATVAVRTATQAQHKGMGWARKPNACRCHVSPRDVCGIAAEGANISIAAVGANVCTAAVQRKRNILRALEFGTELWALG